MRTCTDKKKYKCSKCNKLFTKKKMQNHMRTQCTKIISTRYQLTLVLIKVHKLNLKDQKY